MAESGAFDNESVLPAADHARTIEKVQMNFTYSTSTDDERFSTGADQSYDVSVSHVAGSFDTKAVTVIPRATIAPRRDRG